MVSCGFLLFFESHPSNSMSDLMGNQQSRSLCQTIFSSSRIICDCTKWSNYVYANSHFWELDAKRFDNNPEERLTVLQYLTYMYMYVCSNCMALRSARELSLSLFFQSDLDWCWWDRDLFLGRRRVWLPGWLAVTADCQHGYM